MVYKISDHVDSITVGQIMEAKFHQISTSENNEGTDKAEVRRIWKNVMLINLAFMVHFTAFWGASNLQSSVNAEGALGTFTLASIYGSLLISNILLPALVIKWLGAKRTIAVSFIMYMPFILAQFHPAFYTLIPAGLAVGFGGGPLWCAKCTYLTIIAETYAQITDVEAEGVITRFFGIFFMFFSFAQVWGNLISSAVLSSGDSETPLPLSTTTEALNPKSLFTNATKAVQKTDTDLGDICGANFCPGYASAEAVPNLAPPPAYKINLIAAIYFFCMVAAVLIVTFGVDKMSRYRKGRKVAENKITGWNLLIVTLKHAKKPLQLLMLPITVLIGAEQAFLAAEFTSAFVSCGWGISNIGYVMICFGACNGIASICSGSIVKITGRRPLIAFALVLHVALLVTLLYWRPSAHNTWIYFVVSGLWGVCDSLWLVQINSYSGILFPGEEEAAFSNFRLWESTGSVISYIWSPYLCVRTKIYLLMGLIFVGVLGYTAVEYIQSKNGRQLDLQEDPKKQFEMIDTRIPSREVAE
ncbi:UNC93-like protein isoform X1 [Diabrotica virgifera virgifera]|uniref:UNC93-like protein n=2 Tax=Diabrotica virgifera virgifera TaxID=50390 RepID=A0ABM5ICY9_DIAVI|nr:UNC93-like protein isoform X1 [Diabrotica virgifera virgifera]